MYRTVDSATWDDPWFSELEPLDKLVFLYLITNRRQSASGAFEVTTKAVAFETGIDVQTAAMCLRKLAPKVEWWPEYQVVWLRNFYRHQHAKSNKDNFAAGARNSLAKLPPDVVEVIVNEYPELEHTSTPESEGMGIPSPSHTQGMGIRKQLKETVQEAVDGTRAPVREPATSNGHPTDGHAKPAPITMPASAQHVVDIRTLIEQHGAELMDRGRLLAAQTKLCNEFANTYGKQLTAAQVQEAAAETARYTDGDSLAYFFSVMQRMVEHPEQTKEQRNGKNGKGNHATDPNAPPPKGYSFERYPDGSWRPLSGDADGLPYGARSAREANEIHRAKQDEWGKARRAGMAAGGVN